MATTKKRKTKTQAEETPALETNGLEETTVLEEAPIVEQEPVLKKEKTKKTVKKQEEPQEKMPKFPIGSIVYVSKDADADLNGFKLFPQYKKYTYTVEAYDATRDVYSLRRLNLLLKLKEELIINPEARAHDPINRKQF